MSTIKGAIVLVHGAWGGSYGFRHVRPLLQAAGHQVFTPSLTGIGERSHLASPEVRLSTHVRDLANVILYEDLEDVMLVGFSYGGMVVTGALEHIGDRISHLVYLDAMVPKDGQSIQDLRGGEPTALTIEPSWQVPPLPRQLDDPSETEWFNGRRSMQPIGTFTEPVRLNKPIEDWAFSRTYIKATADEGEAEDSPFWRTAHHADASPAWGYHEVATNHLIPMNRPQELAQILGSISA